MAQKLLCSLGQYFESSLVATEGLDLFVSKLDMLYDQRSIAVSCAVALQLCQERVGLRALA